MEERLDKLLMDRKLVTTRARAEQIIKEFGVKVNGKLIQKTGKKFPIDAHIEMIQEEIPYVSRGAYKLLEAMNTWGINVEGATAMDVGASTGGFTEVLLQHQAAKVYCVDVGSNQLHEKIRTNAKVINLEKTHVRILTPQLIPDPIDVCVIDVSFISIIKIFPFIHAFLKPGATVIALIKPQFEVGKENIAKGGIVKNKKLYPQILNEIKTVAQFNQLKPLDVIESPILGGDGNREFLMLLHKMEA